jgi:hypothetical protein
VTDKDSIILIDGRLEDPEFNSYLIWNLAIGQPEQSKVGRATRFLEEWVRVVNRQTLLK